MSQAGPVNRAARQTYHPNGSGVSEGLKRARKPFRMANAITGAIITSFAVSVYFYSIRAVAQDDFSDIGAPSEEERRGARSIEDEARLQADLKAERQALPSLAQSKALEATEAAHRLESKVQGRAQEVKDAIQNSRHSVLDILAAKFGGKGHSSAFIQSAPPVDSLGRVGDPAPLDQTRRLV